MTVTLRAQTEAQAKAIVAGRRLKGWHASFPTDGDAIIARLWLGAPWQPAPRHVLVDGVVVGGIGTKGAPAEGRVEIGYGIVAELRGQGVGSAALALWLDELVALGLTEVFADTSSDNGPSQRMLLRTGFQVLGENADEVLFSKRL